jgi:hypothetical protein
MFGWVIVSRQLHFHIYYSFVDCHRSNGRAMWQLSEVMLDKRAKAFANMQTRMCRTIFANASAKSLTHSRLCECLYEIIDTLVVHHCLYEIFNTFEVYHSLCESLYEIFNTLVVRIGGKKDDCWLHEKHSMWISVTKNILTPTFY